MGCKKQKLVFFIKTRLPVGGSLIMFIKLGSYIAETRPEYDVYFFNYKNPNLEKLYGSDKLNVRDVDEVDYCGFEDAIFITPYNYALELMDKAGHLTNARVLFYFYHPDAIVWLNNQTHSPVIDMTPFLRTVVEKRGYAFYDGCCLKNCEIAYPHITFEKRYAQVPITVSGEFEPVDLMHNGRYNIGWLGRLDSDKIYSLINLADNLLAMDSEINIDLHVIGDGNSKRLLDLSKYSSRIRFVFTSNLYGDVRNNYIRGNIDIMIAMGMSAIDSAQLGVPTLLPMVAPYEFRDDKFIYIFNSREYSVGWTPECINGSGCKIHTIEDVIKEIYEDGRKTEYGALCRDYVKNVFSIEKSATNLLSLLYDDSMTVGDCMRCRPIKKALGRYLRFSKIMGIGDYSLYSDVATIYRADYLRAYGFKKMARVTRDMAKTFLRGKRRE